MTRMQKIVEALLGDRHADRIVPPSGQTVWLTVLTAGAMAFLAVFALAFTLATGRLADRWGDTLAEAATIQIVGRAEDLDAQVDAAVTILDGTPGIGRITVLDAQDQADLLAPWLGADLPLDDLPLPRLIELADIGDLDVDGLRLRLAAEIPEATLDDHGRWRAPLVRAADRLRLLGWTALLLIAGTVAGMVGLAAQASLAANRPVIRVLRLVGARDAFVARAFIRRFTLRAVTGAAVGTLVGALVIAVLPAADPAGGFLTGLGFRGAGWLLPPLIPVFAGLAAFVATRYAAFRALRHIE